MQQIHGNIAGSVVHSATGEPIEGVTVHATAREEPDAGRAASLAAATDRFGRFDLELDEGPWLLRATSAAGTLLGEARVHVFPNAQSEVTIEATATAAPTAASSSRSRRSGAGRNVRRVDRDMQGSVRGYVVRADSGAPVADATITVVRGAGPAPDIAPLTDDGGRFMMDHLTGGEWVLRALGPDGETGEARFRLRGGATAEVTIQVE